MQQVNISCNGSLPENLHIPYYFHLGEVNVFNVPLMCWHIVCVFFLFKFQVSVRILDSVI